MRINRLTKEIPDGIEEVSLSKCKEEIEEIYKRNKQTKNTSEPKNMNFKSLTLDVLQQTG